MILVGIGAILFAAARSGGRFRLCMRLAEEYAWLRSQEPWAGGMDRWTTDRERRVVEPSRMRAECAPREAVLNP